MTALPHSLERSLVIRAPRDLVFRFFTDSDRFARWWGPGSSIEARVGGSVRIVYPNQVIAGGNVTRLEPGRLIVFTYGYEDPEKRLPIGASLVTITLHDHDDGTFLQLQHDLPDSNARDQHVPGWRFQLALFANVVANEQNAGVIARIDQWFAGWNSTDADERARMLTACATDDVSMQDNYSCLHGRDDLLDHIRMSQRFLPGLVVQRAGEPRHCQGTALVDWTMTDAAGNPRGKGSNVVRLAADGRIAAVVGL